MGLLYAHYYFATIKGTELTTKNRDRHALTGINPITSAAFIEGIINIKIGVGSIHNAIPIKGTVNSNLQLSHLWLAIGANKSFSQLDIAL